MSRYYIGVDTSNYTTSCALYDAAERRVVSNIKRLLDVPEGGRGLRQSDAMFMHTKRLPEIIASALDALVPDELCAVGVSSRPRDVEGSYIPCFLAGVSTASAMAGAAKKPLYRFSHQAGHIAAAVYSSGSPDLYSREFIAFHVSGGTTELLLVHPKPDGEQPFVIEKLGGTLDISAGQAVDRVGVKLGLGFPCGPRLEELAKSNTERFTPARLSVHGCDCNLSGAENLAGRMIESGASAECVAAYLLDFIGRTLVALTENALIGREDLPVLFAGGVMSNSIIKRMITARGCDARFAEPALSSDNAVGAALLAAMREEGENGVG